MELQHIIVFWFIWDYMLLFISEYMIWNNICPVFQEFLFALQITRCQYQEHDYAHLQWDFFISASVKPFIDAFFILTTGISRQWWNDIEHFPHHKNVNDFECDPDDFETLLKQHKLGLLFIMPVMVFRSVWYLYCLGLWFSLLCNCIFVLEIGLFARYYTFSFVLSSFFYILTFALTQWFHHPKQYLPHPNYQLRQVLNSRNTLPHNLVISYWMGGHDYQIEHHLYPTRSRYELPELSAAIYGDDYKEYHFTVYLREIYQVLLE
jgi:fatty acid desaturase